MNFTDYLDREKPYGFYISHAGAFFYKGVRVRCARESIAGINYVIARYNRHVSYDVYTSPKF